MHQSIEEDVKLCFEEFPDPESRMGLGLLDSNRWALPFSASSRGRSCWRRWKVGLWKLSARPTVLEHNATYRDELFPLRWGQQIMVGFRIFSVDQRFFACDRHVD